MLLPLLADTGHLDAAYGLLFSTGVGDDQPCVRLL
jgi:hypothetical protein